MILNYKFIFHNTFWKNAVLKYFHNTFINKTISPSSPSQWMFPLEQRENKGRLINAWNTWLIIKYKFVFLKYHKTNTKQSTTNTINILNTLFTINNLFIISKIMLIKKKGFSLPQTSPIVMLEMESQKWFRLSSLSLKDPLWRIGTTPAFVVPVFKAMEGRSCRSVGEKLIFLGHDFRYFLSWTNECKVEKILKGNLDSITFSENSNYGLESLWEVLLGVVNKLFKTKSLLTSPSNVLP